MARLRWLAHRARYRIRQVLWGLRSAIAPADASEVRQLLSPAELALFAAMGPRDRRHSLLTMRRLERDAAPARPSRDLRVAALMHDVGKGPVALWHRVAHVLLRALSPALLNRVAREGRGWRGALWRLVHHARLGGALLREAASSPRVIELVEAHLTSPAAAAEMGDAELIALIHADGNS